MAWRVSGVVFVVVFLGNVGCVKVTSSGFLGEGEVGVEVTLLFAERSEFVTGGEFAVFLTFTF